MSEDYDETQFTPEEKEALKELELTETEVIQYLEEGDELDKQKSGLWAFYVWGAIRIFWWFLLSLFVFIPERLISVWMRGLAIVAWFLALSFVAVFFQWLFYLLSIPFNYPYEQTGLAQRIEKWFWWLYPRKLYKMQHFFGGMWTHKLASIYVGQMVVILVVIVVSFIFIFQYLWKSSV